MPVCSKVGMTVYMLSQANGGVAESKTAAIMNQVFITEREQNQKSQSLKSLCWVGPGL